jgi:hypothetical protein
MSQGASTLEKEQTELLREMRDLLRLLAEPALAERDKKLRASLREAVGKSKQKTKAVLLMDGLRTQAELCKESGMNDGNLSRFVTTLRGKQLIRDDEKHPKLVIHVSPNFFEDPENAR